MQVTKRDGNKEDVNYDKINKSAIRACRGLKDVYPSEVVLDAKLQLYKNIPTKDIDTALIMSAKSKIEKEPNYSYVAARIFLQQLYKEVMEVSPIFSNLDELYRISFVDNIVEMVEEGLLDERLLKFDLNKLSRYLKIERDNKFKYLGLHILYDRYLLRLGKIVHETPQAFWMRVAMGICLNEKDESYVMKFYDIFSNFYLCPSSPTLFNSGRVRSQLSSCYVYIMEDSIDGIFGGYHDIARLSKYAGGIGLDVTNIRSTNSLIKGTNGESSGLIPFLKIYNDELIAVNQGGLRNGAGVASLEVWHLDIEEFLEIKKSTGDDRRRCHDMHTSLWIPDEFMRRVKNNEDWYLFCPSQNILLHETYGEDFVREYENSIQKAGRGEIKYKKVKAKDLWKNIIRQEDETGEYWQTYKDAFNLRNPQKHCGIIHNTQLCTEIGLNNSPDVWDEGTKIEDGETAVCNLASLNMKEITDNQGNIDWVLLKDIIFWGIRGLDNVIDINFYPITSARLSNILHRPIGLGCMGIQDMLHKKKMPYDCEESVKLSGNLQEFISYYAILASIYLAEERGKYLTYEGSTWSKNQLPIDTYREFIRGTNRIESKYPEIMNWQYIRKELAKFGIRNSNIMAIAPNASNAYIIGCSSSIIPDYSAIWVYKNLSGKFTMINDYLVEELKNRGLWNQKTAEIIKSVDGDISKIEGFPEDLKRRFKTVFNLDYNYLIDCTAERQKWIDQAISFDIYSDKKSMKYSNDLYMRCFDKGLKSTYYHRTLAASKIEKSTCKIEKNTCKIEKNILGEPCESCQ